MDRPKDWYKTMFKQIHKVHKAGESVPSDTEERKSASLMSFYWDVLVRVGQACTCLYL